MNNVIKRPWDCQKLVPLDNLTGMVFQDESEAHTFQITGIDSNGPVSLSGSVSAVFVRPDNADIAINGSISDGKAVITLPEACYYINGRFFLTIFLTSGAQKTAIYAAIGNVARTSGGAVAGDTPQDVSDLIDMINEYSDLLDSVANGHGGIKSIAKTGSTGTNPVIDTYTLTYADDDTFTFTVTNGIQGVPGPAASVTAQSVTYQQGDSPSTAPTGTWQSSPPSVAQGKYLWTKVAVTYSDNTTVTSYSVARQGRDGSGSVSSVNGVSPDSSGNVELSASDVGALPSSYVAPVTSVNGHRGAVSLTASDVGALPDTYTPPVTSVQGRTGAVNISLSDISEIVNLSGGDTHVFNVDNLTRHVFFVIGGAADNLCLVLVGVTSSGAVRSNKIGTASNITVTNDTNQVSIKSASYASTILHLEYAGE